MESALIAIFISLLMGGVAYVVTNSNIPTGTIKVSRRELLIGSAISIVVLLMAGPLIEKLILDNKTTFYEYYNGYQTEAIEHPIVCSRDGSCDDTYNCDPYIVAHYYTDSKGNSHVYYTTQYHHCPYLKTEYSYTIASTLGDYQIGGQYAKSRSAWRHGVAVPHSIQTGPPQQWLQARNDIKAGKNEGVTKVAPYQNLLLASDRTLLDQYSDDIQNYAKESLMPDHTRNYRDPIYDQYDADKFTAVDLKMNKGELASWEQSLMRLNGYFGKQLQGDVHMVAVNAGKVPSPDDYSQAVFAHWKSTAYFGKYTMPKNAVGIVAGIQGGQVVWARATGGLPVGNEALFLDIQNNLKGVSFTPDALIGLPLKKTGALYAQLWGPHKFKRPHNSSYEYLKSDTVVTGWNRFWIVFVATVLSATMWILFLVVDDSLRNKYYDEGDDYARNYR